MSGTTPRARAERTADAVVDADHGNAAGARFTAWFTERRIAGLIELGAVVPVVTTLLEVIRSPRLQFLDYWWVFIQIFNPDGSIRPHGFIRLQNEHFLGVPSLLYWLDARLFGGDNRMLGMTAVLMTAATVLLVRAALPKTLSPVVRASIVFASSFIMFTLHGLHYFSRGMSGVAWLGANLLVVAALVLAFRRRWGLALALALLASVTYGTAFAVWPVLVAVAFVNRETLATRIATVVLGGAVAVGWLAMSGGGGLATGMAPANDLGTLIFRYLTLLGHVWTAESTAVATLAGTAMLVGYAVLATTRTARDPRLRFWWAFAITALLSCGLVALARIDFGTNAGLWGRYTSVSVMGSVPLLVLTVAVVYPHFRRHRHKIAIAVVASGLLAYALGTIAAAGVRSQNHMHALQGVGMRLGLTNAYATLDWPLPLSQRLTPRMTALGHYPFNDDFTLGCGNGVELGSTLDQAKYTPVTSATEPDGGWHVPAGEVQKAEARYGAELIHGWFGGGRGQRIECVVLVDAGGKVVGGGVTHNNADIPPPRAQMPGNHGFTVIGPAGAGADVVAITDTGSLLSVPAHVDEAKQN